MVPYFLFVGQIDSVGTGIRIMQIIFKITLEPYKYCRILWVWMKGNCLFIFFQMARNMFGDYKVNIFNRISVYTTYILVIIDNILIPCKIILIVIFSFLKIVILSHDVHIQSP